MTTLQKRLHRYTNNDKARRVLTAAIAAAVIVAATAAVGRVLTGGLLSR